MKVGFLGGSFDPVHAGHLKLAQAALRQCKLSVVYLVPAACSPFKVQRRSTPAALRLRMLRLALKNKSGLRLGLWELKRRGLSYTIDTLKRYQSAHPAHQLFWIMGSDGLRGFRRWKQPKNILALASLVVGRRPGVVGTTPARVLGKPVFYLKGTFPDISSTAVRRFGVTPNALPRSVARFIRKKGLYRDDH